MLIAVDSAYIAQQAFSIITPSAANSQDAEQEANIGKCLRPDGRRRIACRRGKIANVGYRIRATAHDLNQAHHEGIGGVSLVRLQTDDESRVGN